MPLPLVLVPWVFASLFAAGMFWIVFRIFRRRIQLADRGRP